MWWAPDRRCFGSTQWGACGYKESGPTYAGNMESLKFLFVHIDHNVIFKVATNSVGAMAF